MNRALELLKGKEEVGPNVFMRSDEILSISMDNDLTVEEKKGLFSGKYKSKQQILRDKAKRIEEEQKKDVYISEALQQSPLLFLPSNMATFSNENNNDGIPNDVSSPSAVYYTHLRAHET